MIKIKTADLIGAQLDWAVAKALRPCSKPEIAGRSCFREGYKLPFNPTNNWQHGGPIIEREIQRLERRDGMAFYNGEQVSGVRYLATCKTSNFTYMGRTPLIAAMRAFVASKLGDEVEVPEVRDGL